MANEKRLIFADTVLVGIATFKDCYERAGLKPWIAEHIQTALQMVERFVKETQTVEAAPVVYGRWVYEPIEFTYEKDIKCSVCGGYAERTSNYCPNCGAKMIDNAREN